MQLPRGRIGWSVDGDSAHDVRRTGVQMTVADVLDIHSLRDATVAAGRAGLSRIVTGVNIVEVPDVWQWLRGGEFLLSAAYPWRSRPDQLVDLLAKLDDAGISAIGFKLGQYIDELPAKVLEVADDLALPVVLLPRDVAYRDVFEPLYGRLLARPAEPESIRDVDQALMRFGLDDQSIEKVASGLAAQVGKPVRVVDLVDDIVYFAPPEGVVLRRRFDRVDDETRSLLDRLAEGRPQRRVMRVEASGRRALAAALVIGRRRHGYLLVLDTDSADELEADMTHAVELVSFLLLKRLAFLEGRREASNIFFESLMSDSLSNEEATERALTLGLRLSRPCTVFLVGLPYATGLSSEHWNLLRYQLERCLQPAPHVVTADHASSTMHALVQAGETEATSLLLATQECVEATVDHGIGRRAVIASGAPGLGLTGVRRSRSEALIAYETALRLKREGVIRFADLGVERLLSQIPHTELSRGYVDSLIGAIESDDELLRTLELYLLHGGNKSATAEAIPLHRSSLLYRLKKISTLLGADLGSPEQCQELWLALRLRRVLGPSP